MRNPFILKRLRGDERGVSVVELGLIAPVVALFIAGIIDLSQGLAQRFQMQQAVNRSLEFLLTNPPAGEADDAEVDYSSIAAEAAAAAGVDEDAVTIDRWVQCNDVRQPDFEDTSDCEEDDDIARYVSLSIDKPFTGSFFVGEIDMVATGSMRIQ